MSAPPIAERCAKCGAELTADRSCPACMLDQGWMADGPSQQVAFGLPSFGDYELIEEIARGGMGVVYKARQKCLNRIVAVKMVLAGKLAGKSHLQRFRAEAETAARLQHPNIVAIHEVGEFEGQPFFSMDYVEGKSLAEIAHNQPLPAKRAAGYLKTIVEAVEYAHSKGVLHRDLKPSNILIDQNDQPRITDFGLAKRLYDPQFSTPNPQLTLTGQVLGSPNFMPPEQASGDRKSVGPASDVYSLGAVLYQLLTGRPPFAAETLAQTLRMVSETEPVGPRFLTPNVPLDLESICLKCLEKSPLRRYQTAQTLADDLQRFLHGQPTFARPVGNAEKFGRWCRRNPTLAGLGATALASLLIGLVGISWQWRRAESNAVKETAARMLAETQREDNRRRLVHANVARGAELLKQGDYFSALPWFVEALGLDDGHPAEEEHHRTRIGAVLQQSPQLLHVWFHDGPVHHAEFSLDGRRILTTSADHTAKVWDTASGQLEANLGHRDGVTCGNFRPDGQRVVTGCLDGAVTIWGLTGDPKPIATMKHRSRVNRVTFSPDGLRILSASLDGTACIWDAETGQEVTPPLRHGADVSDARFSPNGLRIATISYDNLIQIWDSRSGAELHRSPAWSRFVFGVAFSPDGRRMVGASWGTAPVLDVETGDAPYPGLKHLQGITQAVFSPDGRRIATASEDQTTRVWDAQTGREMTPPLRHPHAVRGASFNPTGEWIITACDDGAARIWSLATAEEVPPLLKHSGPLTEACFSPGGSLVMTAGSDGVVRLWNVLPALLRSVALDHGGFIHEAAFSRDGHWIVTASDDNTAQIWDAATGKKAGPALVHSQGVIEGSFSADGTKIATASYDRTARVWDRVTCAPLTPPLSHGGPVVAARFIGKNQTLLTISGSKVIDRSARHEHEIGESPMWMRAWSGENGQPLSEPLPLEKSLGSFSISPDGLRIATVCEDHCFRIWDVATGRPLKLLPASNGAPLLVQFSPDGRTLATAASQWGAGEVRLWNAENGQEIAPPIGHRATVGSMAFSPSSKFLVTAGDDGSARVWNATNGLPLTPPLYHRWNVFSVDFSADGRKVVTGSGDHTARIWDAITGESLGPPFFHNGYVHRVAFNPARHQILTALAQSVNIAESEKSAYLWSLLSDNRPLEELQEMAKLLCGHKIDSTSSLVPVEPGSLSRVWSAYVQKRPLQTPAALLDEEAVWRQLERAERARTWPVVLALVEGLPKTETNQARMHKARAQALLHGGDESEGLLEWAAAVESGQVGQDWCLTAAQNWNQANRPARAHRVLQRLLTARTNSVPLWTAHGLLLENEGRLVDAASALRKAIALDAAEEGSELGNLRDNQQRLAKLESRMTAAGGSLDLPSDTDRLTVEDVPVLCRLFPNKDWLLLADNVLTVASNHAVSRESIPPRAGNCPKNLVDLSRFYNALLTNGWHVRSLTNNDLSPLAPGIRELCRVAFDIRGIIQLEGVSQALTPGYPPEVTGIPIERCCNTLHFLHGSGWRVEPGTTVGRYQVHYRNGHQASIPIIYGMNVTDWLCPVGAPNGIQAPAEVAWEGTNKMAASVGCVNRLYHLPWKNPDPASPIETIDFESALTDCAPFLIALTTE